MKIFIVVVVAAWVITPCFAQEINQNVFGPMNEESGVFSVSNIENTSLDELKPFLKVARTASIVGMGEPVHGSHDVNLARATFIKALVEHEGYRALGFEAPWQSSRAANEYIQTCRGKPEAALLALKFPAWFDESTLRLVEWLCEFNRQHQDDPVFLFGFDIQSPQDLPFLKNFFENVDIKVHETIASDLEKCVVWGPEAITKVTEDSVRQCTSALSIAQAALNNNHPRYTQLTSTDSVYMARLSVHSLNAFQAQAFFYDRNDPKKMSKSAQAREDGMDGLFESMRVRYALGAKTILYAHNWHIAEQTSTINYPYLTASSLGTILKRRYGKYYASIGLVAYDVGLNPVVYGGTTTSLPHPTAVDSIELKAHRSGLKYAWIDPKKSFLHPRRTYNLFDLWTPGDRIPENHYSLLFFLDRSDALVIAPGLKCRSPFDCELSDEK